MNALHACPHEIFLQPDQLWFGGGEVRLRTVLGSRVAATFWHPQRQLGGLIHFLPAPPAGNDAPAQMLLSRLLAAMHDECTAIGEYEIKLYCGGRVFASPAIASRDRDEQRRQLDHASGLLRECGARPQVDSPCSSGRRQLLFNLADGERRLQPWPNVEAFARRARVTT